MSCWRRCTCGAVSWPRPRKSGWRSVASEPDTRALLGLARVAAAAGMSREAGEFAAGGARLRSRQRARGGPACRRPRACSGRGRRVSRKACASRRRFFKFPRRASMTKVHIKREAAHGMDRVTMFSGRKRHMNSPIMPITGPLDLAATRRPARMTSASSSSRAHGQRSHARVARQQGRAAAAGARADRRRRRDPRAVARERTPCALLHRGAG